MVSEPEELPEDPYPFCLVDDSSSGVKGSCSTHSSRREVTKEAFSITSAAEVMARFGRQRLALVASQESRARALLGPAFTPFLVESLSAMQWCILERVGRARRLGEITQGRASLQFTGESAKTLFYYRKELMSLALLRKQVHYQKTRGGLNFQVRLGRLERKNI